MNALALSSGLLVGLAYGYVAHRGAFCLNSGFRDLVARGTTVKVKALGLAVALNLVFLPVVLALTGQQPSYPALFPVSAILGGVLFGACMHSAGGCAAGVWYKAGAGDVGAAIAVAGLALGAVATETGPLAVVRAALQSIWAVSASAPPPAIAGVSLGIVSAALGGLLLCGLWFMEDGVAGAWTWRRTGLWIGIIALAAWPASALAGGTFGLSVVPGAVGGLQVLTGVSLPVPSWNVLLVLGIAVGGFLARRTTRGGTPGASQPAALLKRFAGGLGLGIGASLAGGCTVGHGLTGLPLLAPASIVVMLAIFTGSAARARWPVFPRDAATRWSTRGRVA